MLREVLGFTNQEAEAILELSEHPEAIRELKAAVELTPGLPWALSALGQAYAQSGDRAAARRVLDNMLAERIAAELFSGSEHCPGPSGPGGQGSRPRMAR